MKLLKDGPKELLEKFPDFLSEGTAGLLKKLKNISLWKPKTISRGIRDNYRIINKERNLVGTAGGNYNERPVFFFQMNS